MIFCRCLVVIAKSLIALSVLIIAIFEEFLCAWRGQEGTLQAQDDAEDAGWFSIDDLPDIAFPTIEKCFKPGSTVRPFGPGCFLPASA